MAHLRKRYLTSLIERSLKFSPIVAVFGHRQVGKTTLCEQIGGSYITLDQSESLNLGIHSPTTLLNVINNSKDKGPLVIDECQMAPPLFPAMKEWVRTHKKPGQLLLTGSVRFSSRKAIRESLTGRTINWELLPMCLSESHSAPLPHSIPILLDSKGFEADLKSSAYFTQASYEVALYRGGLPGIFAVRDAVVRKQRFETQIETLLERDLRLLIQTSLDYRTLRNLLGILAARQTLPLDLSEISRAARISVPALRRLISALEAMFILRLVETEGNRRKPVLFFEDQGEASHLSGDRPDLLFHMTRFLFSNIRQQWVYRPDLEISLFQYRNRGGAFVPLALRSPRGLLGLIPMLNETPGRHELASASSFIMSYPGARCIFTHLGKSDRMIGDAMRILPISSLV